MTLVVVTGVGTGVGKTHVATALVRAWGRLEPVLGYKPVESGVLDGCGSDEAALTEASTFHVKQSLVCFRLRAPVSPHLAARADGITIKLDRIVDGVAELRGRAGIVVELAGGLFSPLSDTETNADLIQALRPDVTLLVAMNRLGVLHDVRAVYEACRSRQLPLDGIVLSAAPVEDASATTNAAELALTVPLDVLACLPRASVDELVRSGALVGVVRRCLAASHEAAALEQPLLGP